VGTMSKTQLFILVKCDSGFAEHVGQEIIDNIPEALEVFSITGNYDLLVKAGLKDLESMANIVQGKLHKIAHIRETNTFLSFKVLGQDIGDFGD
jgi:DNA-binding Lrp family transcriptional regulator